MAFHLQVSNSLEQLAAKVASEVRSVRKEVFQPVYVVTQVEGMNNWLKLRIADGTGIAANIRFLKPNDLINKIYYLLGGNFLQTLSAESLNWLLYSSLNEKDFIKKFPAVSSYYNYDGIDRDVKRMALAEKVSDLFDQYQIYRADMIEQWNNDKGKQEGEEWQKYLWLRTKHLAQNNFPDKTLIGKSIKEALQNPHSLDGLKKEMPVVYLFGISLITEYHLQIFQNLAHYIDINFLLLNPAPSIYWFEDKSEKQLTFFRRIKVIQDWEINISNPLLTSWGKIIRDTFSLLFKNDELVNAYQELEIKEPARDNLLHKIQHSIFQNEKFIHEKPLTDAEIQDGSITINSCYSPAREVEVLYNYLVHLVDKKNESLSSRDIIVMVSDIDLYASYIKAIFDNAPYEFKYTIADESHSSSNSISSTLLAVLSVTEQNFSAEEVVRLLDYSFIRERFQITDISLIRNVVNEANIRFGIEGNLKDDSLYMSWKYGLKRIMYGICMNGGDEFGTGDESFYPLDIVEGNTSHEVIRFVHFAEALMDMLNERKKARAITGWVEYVDAALHNFVCNKEETTDEDYGLLLNQLENYNSFSELFTEEISYEVFIHSFSPTLLHATRSKSFAGGGITFCSLIPMRSIPFKVVSLLGMNFDKFPRKENNVSFNLMEKEKRRGDRNVKENDKHLFLETLLSAKNYLYISYIGQSLKDNSTLPPSVLVDELMDYIASATKAPAKIREQLVTLHPMHGFSKKYHNDDERLYSYPRIPKHEIKDPQKEKIIEPLAFEEVSLANLIAFLKNPCKGYYNKVLGIYYNTDDVTLRDTELFQLDTLQRWWLKNPLLNIDEEERENYKSRLLKTGALPLKNMAEIELKEIETEILPGKQRFHEIIKTAEEKKLPVDIEIDGCRLRGTIPFVYDNALVFVSWSKRETKYLLDAYIHYLAAIAAGYKVKLYFISAVKDDVFLGAEISRADATSRLKELLDLYKQGYENILPFDPGFKIKPDKIEDINEHFLQRELKDKFENFSYTSQDVYMNNEYNNGFFDKENIIENFKRVARKLISPLAELFPGYYDKR
jgi:exodeoxyribonuclease V gamma subunit